MDCEYYRAWRPSDRPPRQTRQADRLANKFARCRGIRRIHAKKKDCLRIFSRQSFFLAAARLIAARKKRTLISQSPLSCGRRDLNPYAKTMHKILSLARLPIPTLPRDQLSLTDVIIHHASQKVNSFFEIFSIVLNFCDCFENYNILSPTRGT